MSLEKALLQFIEKKKVEAFNAVKSTSVKTSATKFSAALNEGKFAALSEIEKFIHEYTLAESKEAEKNIEWLRGLEDEI